MAWSLAGFVAGVLAAAALPPWPSAPVAVLAGLSFGAFVSFALARRPAGAVPALALLAGIVAFTVEADRQSERSWPVERSGEIHVIEGRILGLPESRGDLTRLQLRVERGPVRLRTVELAWFRSDGWPRPGERWRIDARLESPQGRMNPGAYDRARARFAARIDAVGRVESATRLEPGGPVSALARFRQDASDWLQARIPDVEAAALVRALAVGDRSGIGPDLAERLRATGTAHLLAISGLHVGLVFGFGALITGGLAVLLHLRWPWPERRRQAVIGGLAVAAVYAALSGFALPTRRALLMLVVALGATLLRRPLAPGRALLLALGAVLLIDPLAPLALGFWLSFAAVAVLVWAFAGRPASGGSGAMGLVRAQLVLALGLLPLNLGLFHQWTPAGLLANLVAIPVVAFFILPSGLLAVVGYGLNLATDGPARAAGWAMARLDDGLAALSALAPPVPADGQPGWVAIGFALLGALWLLAPRGWPARPLGLVLLVPLFAQPRLELPHGGFELHLVDVGDGQAIAIRTRTSTLLYGTGPGDGGASTLVPGTIAPTLRAVGSQGVDRLLVPGSSRGQAGGLAEARRRWPDAEVFGRHRQVAGRCTAGRGWTIDGVAFRVLHPARGLPEQGGDDDCVLLVASPAGRVLLPGRSGPAAIRRLRGRTGPVDAVVVPRQGHRDGADPAWWEEMRPAVALVSVDVANRWGLPHAVFRTRLDSLDIPLHSTADCGAISLILHPGRAPELRTEAHRLDQAWRSPGRCRRS